MASVTQMAAGTADADLSQQQSHAQQMLETFWPDNAAKINNIDVTQEFKTQILPLARIKKIMRLDEDVKMISAEAPVLFAKAAEIFIAELSLRAWIHTEDNKRRTLQKNDVSQAVAKSDQFDFLIDIVPRDEIKPAKREENIQRTGMMPDQVQYYLQLAQQTQQALQNQPTSQVQANGVQQVITTQTQQQAASANVITLPQPSTTGQSQQPQIIQIQTPASTPQSNSTEQQQQHTQEASQATTQVFQQHVDSLTGQVVNTPITLTQEQLQAIQLQMQGKQPGQAIVIQTQPGSQEADQDRSQQPTPLFQVPLGDSQQVFLSQDNEDSSDQPQIVIQKQER